MILSRNSCFFCSLIKGASAAAMSRAIPRNLLECSVVHHERFDDAKEGEFEVFCK